MKELLQNYSLQDILIFLVVFALAIKGFINFWDWAKERLKQFFQKEEVAEKIEDKVEKGIQQHKEDINKIREDYKKLVEHIEENNKLIQLLIKSDKDDIKAWITKEHHFFCYKQGYIDDYSLDCLEKRFEHYKDEGGNSFIETLMNEIRNLPKVSNVDVSKKMKEIKEEE